MFPCPKTSWLSFLTFHRNKDCPHLFPPPHAGEDEGEETNLLENYFFCQLCMRGKHKGKGGS
jgi:hypothetical protein